MSNLKQLQDKAGLFFDQFFEKHQSQMLCSKGCGDCCYVDLNIMPWEADLIEHWFKNLSPLEQNDLKKQWQDNTQVTKSVFGEEKTSCVFLSTHDHACTIYPARPIICRTQGMAMQWREDDEVLRSWCEHNFKDQDHLSPVHDDLNLDTLNTMIAHAQNIWSGGENNKEKDLERISLQTIHNHLSQQ